MNMYEDYLNLLTWLNGDHDGDALVILGLAKSIRAKLHQFTVTQCIFYNV